MYVWRSTRQEALAEVVLMSAISHTFPSRVRSNSGQITWPKKETPAVLQCAGTRMKTVLLRDHPKWRPGQVKGLHAILSNYTERSLFPASPPPIPAVRPRGHTGGSSHLPSLSLQDGPIRGRARSAPGSQRHRAPLCTATFLTHILWMRDHTSAPAIETMTHPPVGCSHLD